jgi:RNA polymerase sigma-70 factor (ECF subfamily)
MNGLQTTVPLADLAALAPPESVSDAAAPDLQELTKGICRGDEAAFALFYDRYSLRLYQHLLVLAKGNENEAREALQIVVLKLARKFRVFDEERRMWRWLFRLARNSYVDLCRVQRREQRLISLEENITELAEPRASEDRLSASLNHALDQLTADERELLRAAYVDDCPLQELAGASGQTYKAVESRLGRLRRKLKAIVLNHLHHEEHS